MIKYNVNSCEGIYNKSLDVRFGKQCDNACSFCIEKEGADSFGTLDIDKMIKSTNVVSKEEVLILGGEPFLHPYKLLYYIQNIRDTKEKIFITTSLPKTVDINDKVIRDIIDLVDGINCSIHHHKSAFNNLVLRASSKHDRLEILRTLLGYANDKIRVQTNLVKGVLDNRDDLLVFMRTMRKLGLKTLKINELQNASDVYVSYEEIMGTKLSSPYASGCQTYSRYVDMTVILKRSCFIVEESLQPTDEDLEKLRNHKSHSTTVLYENGNLENGWLSKQIQEVKNELDPPQIQSYADVSCHGSSTPSMGCH